MFDVVLFATTQHISSYCATFLVSRGDDALASKRAKKSPFSWQMPIWLTWYSPLEFDYVALLQLRYCLFFVAQNMTVESKHHHGGTPFQILFSLPIWGRDWIGEIPEKIETSWLCSSQGLLSLLIKESSAHHHSFHFFFMKVFVKFTNPLIHIFKPLTPSFIIKPLVPLYVAWFFFMIRFYLIRMVPAERS